jgi:hypothetical protein
MQEYGFSFRKLPWLYPTRKKLVQAQIRSAFLQRWAIVANRLQVTDVAMPRLEIKKTAKSPYNTECITISYSAHLAGQDSLWRALDHEIAHHIQFVKNESIKTSNRRIQTEYGILYWLLKGKTNRYLAKKAFCEGFAIYVEFLINGYNKKLENYNEFILKRNISKLLLNDKISSLVPYLLGYLAFKALSDLESEKYSVNSGLSLNYIDWLNMSRNAMAKLNQPCYFEYDR